MAAGVRIDENTDWRLTLIGEVENGIYFLEANMKESYEEMHRQCLELLGELKEHNGTVKENNPLYRKHMVVGHRVNQAIKGRI